MLLENIVKVTGEDALEDWPSIMKIVDEIDIDNSSANEAIRAIYRRLDHPSELVCLNTFTLLVALVQNCESAVKSHLLESFTTNIIRKLYREKITSPSSKEKIRNLLVGLISEATDVSLKALFQNSLNEVLSSTDSPDFNQNKKDKIQQAIALSYSPTHEKSIVLDKIITSLVPYHSAEAMYALTSSQFGDLSFEKGDIINVIDTPYKDWWVGELNGRVGYLPSNYVL
ncbi:ESCRT-0 subunit protein hse1, variant 2 [Entomophthora muscae]|uniref:ESCRT-0 subunit protein hse1, variant 2 n=1 Tax=Entomophthora muscae TaxID=34485 RepID=A0ACC2TWY1_9FUNG|nr:ESCRT-0 subunit protein hse1, variant 2 [Entomophthora muscae]